MSIKNTIIGRIVKIAKIKWDKLSEKEAECFVDKIQTGKEANSLVTYGSEISAISATAKIAGLNVEQVDELINDVYEKDFVRKELAQKIRDKIDGANKNENILNILSSIHNEWVKNNSNKFMARPKDYQFVDLRLLPYNEVESDLIFLQAILEGCGISVDKEELKAKFYDIQIQYLKDEHIISHDELVEKLMQGSKFYSSLESVTTDKGIEDGENIFIDDLIKNKEVAENMAGQIEQQICHHKTDLHTHLNAALPSEALSKLSEELLGKNVDPRLLEITENVSIFNRMQDAYSKRKEIIDELLENGYGEDFIKAVSQEYKTHGIEYAELTTDIKMLEKIKSGEIDISSIEKEHGINLRFLLGLNRNNLGIEAFNNPTTQNLFLYNPYLVGIDVMRI